MGKQLKKLVMLGLAAYAVYWLLGHHVIFFGRQPEVLKKQELVFKHTFVSIASEKELKYKGLDTILANEDLYEAGIGDLLVERGWVTREELREVERELY